MAEGLPGPGGGMRGDGPQVRGLLFTDLEGSTRLVRDLGDRYGEVLGRHHDLLRVAVANEAGEVIGSEGDSIAATFPTAVAAIRAAAAAQAALAAEPWPGDPWLVRMAVHAGPVDVGPSGATGVALHHAARVRNAAHGGQILVTDVARQSAEDAAPTHLSFVDLGVHALRDVERPLRLHQLAGAGLRLEFPPLRTRLLRRVPQPRSSFVGRRDEVDDVLGRLGTTSLVTLVGPGGCGKTRLALEVAVKVDAPEVVVVELAALGEPEQVLPAVAEAIGIADPAAVVGSLGDREVVIVLDNCEHVVEAVVPLVSRVLRDAPQARVLATSREPLGVDGEVIWPVPRLEPADASQLFRERAPRSLRPGDDDHVDSICGRLDGVPLAIELAAARTRSMALADIASRLDDQMGLLVTGRRDVPRHQTLRATLDWSHDLLTDAERTVTRWLSVFAGGFTLQAAERVVGRPEVADALDALVLRSLAEFDPDAGRYRQLEPVRQYAAERLRQAGEEIEARQAHLAWVVELARSQSARMYQQQREAVAVLDAEARNVETALTWAIDAGELTTAARIAQHLAFYWFTSRRAGIEPILDRIVSGAAAGTANDRARALAAAGLVLCDVDDPQPVDWLREAVDHYEASDQELPLGNALFWLGRAYAVRGDLDGARATFRRAAASFERTGMTFGLGWAKGWLGLLTRVHDRDLDAAEQIQHEVLELGTAADLPHVAAAAVAELGNIALERGDAVAAVALLDDAIRLFEEVGDRWQVAVHTAMRSLARPVVASAALDVSSALAMLDELHAEPDTQVTLYCAAFLLHTANRAERAATLVGAAVGRDAPGRWLDDSNVGRTCERLLHDPSYAPNRAAGRRLGLRAASREAQAWLAELAADPEAGATPLPPTSTGTAFSPRTSP